MLENTFSDVSKMLQKHVSSLFFSGIFKMLLKMISSYLLAMFLKRRKNLPFFF